MADKFPIHLEPTAKIGDLLTSVSIILSALGLIYTLQNNAAVQRKQQANQVRGAAAATLAKIERWEELSLYAFDDLQPNVIRATAMYNGKSDAEALRDYLWTSIDEAKLRAKSRFMNEQVQSAYVNLYSYSPSVRPLFLGTITKFEKSEDDMYSDLSINTQQIVESMLASANSASPEDLGEKLRETLSEERNAYQNKLRTNLGPAQTFLTGLVDAQDDTLLADHQAAPE